MKNITLLGKLKNNRGVSLIELIITLTIFSIIFGLIYSVYNSFIAQVTIERKSAKTEMDVVTTEWPLIKEISTAGFGTPVTTGLACSPAINLAGGVLTIHSTAASDNQHAGKWSFSDSNCNVSNLPTAAGDNNVVVIDAREKKRLGSTTVSASNALATCNDSLRNNSAYWVPTDGTGSNLECYETSYYLQALGTAPAMCTGNTRALVRQITQDTANPGTAQPLLDCVYNTDGTDSGLNFRFGCIDSNGNLTWQAGTNCVNSKLKLVKIGILVQASPRRDVQGLPTITFFQDMPAGMRVTIDFSADERFFKWKIIEQTIALRNAE